MELSEPLIQYDRCPCNKENREHRARMMEKAGTE